MDGWINGSAKAVAAAGGGGVNNFKAQLPDTLDVRGLKDAVKVADSHVLLV